MSLLSAKSVDIVFGSHPKEALKLLDQNKDRLQIRELCGDTIGVSNANLEVEEGETLVLMGKSGSGKSSLLRAFNGLNQITRGHIYFKDKIIDDFLNFRRKEISMVFQKPSLLPWRTVFENSALGLEIRGLNSSEIKKTVMEKLECVGLENWSDCYPNELSGGMQQRVGIARALATESKILLMDEPFSALDPLTRSGLQQELISLQKKFKKTIVFVTHDLNEALLLGTKIAIIDQGLIIQVGSPKEISNSPINSAVENLVKNSNNHCPRCEHRALI